MFKLNGWNENEKFSPGKIAQDVIRTQRNTNINTSCCVDTTNLDMIESSCSRNIKTSCCIDTTRITPGPCGSDIQTSCCIDTSKE